jgi:hypothetical protein
VSAAGRVGVARKKMVRALATSVGITDASPKSEFVERLLQLSTGHGRPEKAPRVHILTTTGDDDNDENGSGATEKKKEKVKAKSVVSLHGALLIQSILHYPIDNAKPMIDSIHAQSIESLVGMACDPTASRVVECMLTVTTIDDAGKRRFVDRFKGQFAHVCIMFMERSFIAFFVCVV